MDITCDYLKGKLGFSMLIPDARISMLINRVTGRGCVKLTRTTQPSRALVPVLTNAFDQAQISCILSFIINDVISAVSRWLTMVPVKCRLFLPQNNSNMSFVSHYPALLHRFEPIIVPMMHVHRRVSTSIWSRLTVLLIYLQTLRQGYPLNDKQLS